MRDNQLQANDFTYLQAHVINKKSANSPTISFTISPTASHIQFVYSMGVY